MINIFQNCYVLKLPFFAYRSHVGKFYLEAEILRVDFSNERSCTNRLHLLLKTWLLYFFPLPLISNCLQNYSNRSVLDNIYSKVWCVTATCLVHTDL